MPHVLFVAPASIGVGLTTVSIGLCRALDRVGLKVRFCKPIDQRFSRQVGFERSTALIRQTMNLHAPDPLDNELVRAMLSANKQDELMEEVVRIYQEVANDADVVVVEGLVEREDEIPAQVLNAAIVKTLDAQVILVAAQLDRSLDELSNSIEIGAQAFGGTNHPRVLGLILNKVGAPAGEFDFAKRVADENRLLIKNPLTEVYIRNNCRVLQNKNFALLGFVPWQSRLNALRTLDFATYLDAKIINDGHMATRRVMHVAICARTVSNVFEVLAANYLLVTSGDREDLLVAAAMATQNDVPLAGMIFTGAYNLSPEVIALCEPALRAGLPLMAVPYNTYETAMRLSRIETDVRVDDVERIEQVMDYMASCIDTTWLRERFKSANANRLSPPAFRYRVVQEARAANKKIVLPEGEEPRTIEAAITCHLRGIAQCILLGRKEEVIRVARGHNLELPPDLVIIQPDTIRADYVPALVELRKNKKVSEVMAFGMLEDNVVLGTMMLATGQVDGLVAGALGSTANTIRPALQLIKTKPDARLVSSIFFMCLPDQVYVYGDCAVNPNPDAEQLADIAIQSANSAIAFGIEPRIAMISYSTGTSGAGADVDKVKEATRIAKSLRPDLLIDGPLQYDAAAIEEVGRLKAPNSPVAGRATVFIFPDLNTGNTTYKAVQRSANVVSIGPMLQGLRKPVNDLSRGALVQDIVYTIALTAIQASSDQNR